MIVSICLSCIRNAIKWVIYKQQKLFLTVLGFKIQDQEPAMSSFDEGSSRLQTTHFPLYPHMVESKGPKVL